MQGLGESTRLDIDHLQSETLRFLESRNASQLTAQHARPLAHTLARTRRDIRVEGCRGVLSLGLLGWLEERKTAHLWT